MRQTAIYRVDLIRQNICGLTEAKIIIAMNTARKPQSFRSEKVLRF